jgi:hypothetical protein
MDVGTATAILTSSFAILGGLLTVGRTIWKAAQDVRDNKGATVANTKAVGELSARFDHSIANLESRIEWLERLSQGYRVR